MKKNFWLYLAGLIVLAFLLIIVIKSLGPSPQKTVIQYFNFIKLEQYNKAYDLLGGTYKQTKGDFETFRSMFENVRQHGTIYEKVRIIQTRPTKKVSQKIVAFILYTREKGRKTEANGSYVLEKDKTTKQWKIVDSLN